MSSKQKEDNMYSLLTAQHLQLQQFVKASEFKQVNLKKNTGRLGIISKNATGSYIK